MHDNIQYLATFIFLLAIIHTFLSSQFQHLAQKYPEGSVTENFFHLLGEIEVVFGLWAAIFIVLAGATSGWQGVIAYIDNLNFTEPVFVFAIMAMAATKPVLELASKLIFLKSKLIPLKSQHSLYFCALVVGPLMGSFITEPAAMTVTALILKQLYFDRDVSQRFKYITLAVLFVNVSIGGILTPFAAPPVLMVAGKWNWDITFMMKTFGWRSVLAVVFNAGLALTFVRRELDGLTIESKIQTQKSPWWLYLSHLLFLVLVVATAHHPKIFIGIFLFFLGVVTISKEFQEPIKLRESLLVSFFLGGLVVLGNLQSWWLKPLLESLTETPLFLGTTVLTAVTDNAAITYLASQLDNLSESMKYAVVAGAVAGGGLTVIANAPNPAGFSILQDSFGPDRIKPLRLFLYALVPTLSAMFFLWI